MSRMINADLLQKRICGAKCGCEYEDCGCEGDCIFDHFISSAPTVDAVEVVYGRWEKHSQSDEVYICSECCLNIADFEMRWLNYCPNCGAKMTEGVCNET
jgi:hypothetical protein